jgi:large subunit ribosomal protein L4
MEGGGVAFPPIPHGWHQKVPKKVRGLARRSAFNARAEEDRVVLVDALKLEAPKTAEVRDFLKSIEAPGKILFLTEGQNQNLYLSARNLPGVEVRPFGEESAYDVLWATTVIIERGALENVEAPQKSGARAGTGAEEKEEAPDA